MNMIMIFLQIHDFLMSLLKNYEFYSPAIRMETNVLSGVMPLFTSAGRGESCV
jgi:hypothetical protein